jgi:putative ABC transport system permease protein
MKHFPFVLKHLRRNWLRTLSTVAAMGVCIFLFCTLQTLVRAVEWNLRSADDSRLVNRHSVSLVFYLPLAYRDRIAAVPGVEAVAINNWFAGMLGGDMRNFFPNAAVDAEPFLAIYPEFMLSDEQRKAFLADPRGCVIGYKLAERFGWKLGDTFQLESALPPYRVGPLEFVVRGIYQADQSRYPGTETGAMLFHFKYLYEATGQRTGVGTYIVKIADPRRAGEIARTLDGLFENSAQPTRTETESAFRAGIVSMAGNLALLLNLIGVGVVFTILLVTANTMSMAVRERRTEIGVLKTLGFSSRLVMGLVLGEGLLLGVLGGALGLFFAQGAIENLPYLPIIGGAVRGYPDMDLSPQTAGLGLGMAVLIGVAAGFLPALAAYRARIVDMLSDA